MHGELFRWESGSGSTIRLAHLRTEEIEYWGAVELERFENELTEELEANAEQFEVTVEAVIELPELTACWIHQVDGCGHADCECGILPLLDVLDWHLPQELHQSAMTAHLKALSEAYAHFWTGHALVAGRAEQIGSACASCLVVGAEHLEQLLEEAGDLALSAGEALAAFESAVHLGAGRFDAQVRPR